MQREISANLAMRFEMRYIAAVLAFRIWRFDREL